MAIVQATVLGEFLIIDSSFQAFSLVKDWLFWLNTGYSNMVHSKVYIPPCLSVASMPCTDRMMQICLQRLGSPWFLPFLHYHNPMVFLISSYFTSVQKCLRTVLTCFSYSECKPVLMDICMFYGTKTSVAFGLSNKINSYTETSSTAKALNIIVNYHESLSTSSSGTRSSDPFLPSSINQSL